MALTEEELEELRDQIIDVFERNMKRRNMSSGTMTGKVNLHYRTDNGPEGGSGTFFGGRDHDSISESLTEVLRNWGLI